MRVSITCSIVVIVVVASSHRCVIETLLCGSRYSKPSEDGLRYGIILAAPDAWDRLDRKKKLLLGFLVSFATDPLDTWLYDHVSLFELIDEQPGPMESSDSNIREFWDYGASDCPPLSELFQAIVSLFSRGVETKARPSIHFVDSE